MQTTAPTLWDAGNVVAPSPTASATISPALGFLGITAANCLEGNGYGAFTMLTTGPCEVTMGGVAALQRNGTTVASAAHCVVDTVPGTAGKTSTKVSFAGPAEFKTTTYTLLIQDVTTFGSPIVPTSQLTSSFTFPSAGTDSYAFIACGV